MLGGELEVPVQAIAVGGVVFDADVGERDVPAAEGEFVGVGKLPAGVIGADAGLPVGVDEDVVLALELVVEDDTGDPRPSASIRSRSISNIRYSWASCASSRGLTRPA